VAGTSQTVLGSLHAFRTAPNSAINPLTDDLGTLGGVDSYAGGINSLGQVIGLSLNAAGAYRAYRTAPNTPINPRTDDLGTLGGTTVGGINTDVYGIDDSGRAVGESRAASGLSYAFRTAPNSPINPATDNLGGFGGRSSAAFSINNAGDIAGWYLPFTRGGAPVAVLFKGGVVTQQTPVGTGLVGGINDLDQIALGDNLQAYLWDNGTLTNIAGGTSAALGINNSGQVVGFAAGHAFLYTNGTMYDLNNLIPPNSGWTLSSATGINDLGQIAGYGQINGQTHAFRLDPPLVGDPPPADASTISGHACNGVFTGTFHGNLTASSGQSCTFTSGTIAGSMTLNGGTLVLDKSTVNGDLQVQSGNLTVSGGSTVLGSLLAIGAVTFSIGPSAVIQGDLNVQNVPAEPILNRVCGVTVNGTLGLHNSSAQVDIGGVSCAGNTIGGNLRVLNNAGSTQVFGNTVGNNLDCEHNTSVAGGGNTARHKQGQCAGF